MRSDELAIRPWDPAPLTDRTVPNLSRYLHPDQKITRDKLRDAARCINGPRDLTIPADTPSKNGVVHGKVISGGKCQRCLDVAHKSRGGKVFDPNTPIGVGDIVEWDYHDKTVERGIVSSMFGGRIHVRFTQLNTRGRRRHRTTEVSFEQADIGRLRKVARR